MRNSFFFCVIVASILLTGVVLARIQSRVDDLEMEVVELKKRTIRLEYEVEENRERSTKTIQGVRNVLKGYRFIPVGEKTMIAVLLEWSAGLVSLLTSRLMRVMLLVSDVEEK